MSGKLSDCPMCDGAGHVEYESCFYCGGTGQIKTDCQDGSNPPCPRGVKPVFPTVDRQGEFSK